jgi:hypothetical protein
MYKEDWYSDLQILELINICKNYTTIRSIMY